MKGDYDECASCGEGVRRGECGSSERACAHHCNCSWESDYCHFCEQEVSA